MSMGVTVDFNANVARFSTQLDRATQDMSRFQQSIESGASKAKTAMASLAGAISVGAITAFVKSGIDAGDALNDLADRTGIVVEKLAGLQLAAKLSDTDMQAFSGSVNKLSIYIAKNAESMQRLGVDSKDPLQAFEQFADVFARIEDPQKRAALGAAVLGKSYAEMAPLLLGGSKAMEDLIAKGQKMSTWTTETAAQAADFNDALDTMVQRVESLSSVFASGILPGLTNFINKLNQATSETISFNNVLKGIGNFVFDVDATRGLDKGIAEINEKIVAQKQKIETLKNEGGLGGLVDGLLGYDINEEKNKLDEFIKIRNQKIAESVKGLNKPAQLPAEKTQVNIGAVNSIIGLDDGSSKAKTKSADASKKLADAEATREKSILAVMQALSAEINVMHYSAKAKELYAIDQQVGKIATDEELRSIVDLVDQKYKLIEADKLQEKQWQALIADANEYYDLRKSIGELSDSNVTSDSFASGLGRIADSRSSGAINDEQAKQLQDQLGKGFNDSVSLAKKSTDVMSTYAEQAARNMQDAFAEFLFDPFKGGVEGMVSNFGDAIKRMLANYAASQIADTLKAVPWGSLASSAGSYAAGFFHEGGIVGSGGGTISVHPSVFNSALRYHSGGIAGLKSDEVPAILQRGELVISNKQLSKASSINSGTGDISISTQVNVSGNGDSPERMRIMGNQINSMIKEYIYDQKRPGGILA